MADLLTQLLGNKNEGWESLDERQALAANERNAQSQMEAALTIARPFLNPEGAACLASLRASTIEQPCFVPGAGSEMGFTREGQNSIVRYIETCIRVATSGLPNVGMQVSSPVEQPLSKARHSSKGGKHGKRV